MYSPGPASIAARSGPAVDTGFEKSVSTGTSESVGVAGGSYSDLIGTATIYALADPRR